MRSGLPAAEELDEALHGLAILTLAVLFGLAQAEGNPTPSGLALLLRAEPTTAAAIVCILREQINLHIALTQELDQPARAGAAADRVDLQRAHDAPISKSVHSVP